MEDLFYKDGQALVSWGANLALVPPSKAADAVEVLEAVLNTLEHPTPRRVGAVLFVLHKLCVEAPSDFLQLRSLSLDRSTDVIRRLGYLLERGGSSGLFRPTVKQTWMDAADILYNKYLLSRHRDDADFLTFLPRVRPSDLKKERDATHLKWGVLAPADVWGEYVGFGDV